MVTQERVYTVDDVWRLEAANENPLEKYYLIDGEFCVKMSPNQSHAAIASLISYYLQSYVLPRGLGRVLVECGYLNPGERPTLLLPDVSFESRARAAQPPLRTYAPYMPDLAVEIISPSQSLAQVRRKAETYLRYGSALVWLINPQAKTAEVWTALADGDTQREAIALDGELRAGAALPGFSLPLRRIFPD